MIDIPSVSTRVRGEKFSTIQVEVYQGYPT